MNDLTDDLGLSPEFLADEDTAREDDDYGRPRRCSCGRLAALEGFGPQYPGDAAPHADDFPGCRGCDPVNPECKPCGFGIEPFEDEERLAVRRGSEWVAFGALKMPHPERLAAMDRHTGISRRRLRHSDLVWERLCGRCETHREAVASYKRWAKRSLAVRYRDES